MFNVLEAHTIFIKHHINKVMPCPEKAKEVNINKALEKVKEEVTISTALLLRLAKQAKDNDQALLCKEVVRSLNTFPDPYERDSNL